MSDNKPVRKTFPLRLTKFELIHLRDLFSILTPPDAKTTVSQALANTANRQLIEAVLWKKVSALCTDADVAMNDDAPDFIIAPAGPPALAVFELSHDPNQVATTSGDEEDDDDDEDEDD